MNKRSVLCVVWVVTAVCQLSAQANLNNQKIDGYRGIWFTLGQFSEYGDKYSGGLGTYTAKHRPMAIYDKAVDKTFFVYGGTPTADQKYLLCMISYFDHKTGLVPKPMVVYDKLGVDDPHDDPSLSIDDQGYLWVFVSGRGKERMGFKYRSDKPYDISSFTLITREEMTYPQPIFDTSLGFFHFFTKYTGLRELYFETSRDGITWSDDKKLAGIIEEGATRSGHYQVSAIHGDKICTFFNRHPDGNVNLRTDLFYVQTKDFGKNWATIQGHHINLPMTTVHCGARLIDYAGQKLNVYLKDVNFDAMGNPICLYVTSGGHEPGPQNNPREWRVTYYDGTSWQTSIICQSDHNYDMGSLYVDGQVWRVIAPTETDPQPHQGGGEVVIWESVDHGKIWYKKRQITENSIQNHNYIRRPENAEKAFYAFWADGNPNELSPSNLYFLMPINTRYIDFPIKWTRNLPCLSPLKSRDSQLVS